MFPGHPGLAVIIVVENVHRHIEGKSRPSPP